MESRIWIDRQFSYTKYFPLEGGDEFEELLIGYPQIYGFHLSRQVHRHCPMYACFPSADFLVVNFSSFPYF